MHWINLFVNILAIGSGIIGMIIFAIAIDFYKGTFYD